MPEIFSAPRRVVGYALNVFPYETLDELWACLEGDVLRIKELLYDRGFTIAGARKVLSKSRGSKSADRDEVLIRVRNELKDILTLLRRKT